MADQKIWSNETGQVLLGAGGMVLRQPFNFQNGFYQGVNATIVLKVTLKTPLDPNYYAVDLWNGLKDISSGTATKIVSWPFSNPINSIGRTTGLAGYFVYEGFASYRQDAIGGNSHRTLSRSVSNVITISNKQINTWAQAIGITPISDFKIGLIQGRQSVGWLRVFNRPLTTEESIYIYANGLGAIPMTRQGLVLEIEFNRAEILDFSSLQDGSDMRVGCRDISGLIQHAEFINLPAGTNQEKCDWANANLFTLLF